MISCFFLFHVFFLFFCLQGLDSLLESISTDNAVFACGRTTFMGRDYSKTSVCEGNTHRRDKNSFVSEVQICDPSMKLRITSASDYLLCVFRSPHDTPRVFILNFLGGKCRMCLLYFMKSRYTTRSNTINKLFF